MILDRFLVEYSSVLNLEPPVLLELVIMMIIHIPKEEVEENPWMKATKYLLYIFHSPKAMEDNSGM